MALVFLRQHILFEHIFGSKFGSSKARVNPKMDPWWPILNLWGGKWAKTTLLGRSEGP